jgi:hypothetical protein
MASETLRKNVAVYSLYLLLLAVIGIAARYLGLDSKVALWAAIGIACVFGVLWPRW